MSKETFVFAADDSGKVYLDGKLVAKTLQFYEVARFSAESKRIRVIAVSVLNFNIGIKSNVGFILQSPSGIVSDQSWKCFGSNPQNTWTSSTFNDSSWASAVCYARNRDYNPLEGIAADTCWISTTGSKVYNIFSSISCRKVLSH